MLHTFRANERFRSRIESALRRIKRALDTGQLATLEAKRLSHVVTEGAERTGSKPRFTLRSDDDGSRYVFKQCEPALAAAEEAAFALSSLGGRPGVPARAFQLDLDGSGLVAGLLKPFVEFEAGHELAADTTSWSPEQRAVMLLGHAWEWFLDNLDTNTSQYALLGPLALPVNIDWDRAFYSEARSELSRFAKYRPSLPNARTFLYADYVAGKIELPLWLLATEARRIRRLPKAEVRAIAQRYARVRYEDEAAREQFVSRMSIRQHGIEREVASFMRTLWSERKQLRAAPAGAREALRQQMSFLWAEWQVVLNAVLRGPIGVFARRMLSLFRGRRLPPRLGPLSPELPNARLREP
jgi:hypothetical protein